MEKTSTGLEQNINAALCYLWFLGLIFFLIEKDNKFVRFNGLQATFIWVAQIVISIPFWIIRSFLPYYGAMWSFFGIITTLIGFAAFAAAVFCAVKAFSNETFKLPFIGDLAEKHA